MNQIVLLLLVAVSAQPLSWAADAAGTPAHETTLSGTWRGFLSQGTNTWHFSVTLKGKGKSYTGVALGWRNLPEQIALAGRNGPAPKEHPLACLYTESVKVVDDGKEILLDSAGLRTLIGGSGNLGPDRFRLTQSEPGVLVGKPLKADGSPSVGRVLLCTQARWDKPSLDMPKAGTTSEITCVGGDYHYRLQVPKSFDPAKPPPLLVHVSAGGNARPYMPELVEEFGWINIGLTESKNGPWDPITENRDAVLLDLRQRLRIDWSKVMFGGGSGGARASAMAQLMHPDICAGLLLAIAGYDQATPPPKRVPIFFITGDQDFNLKEVLACYQASQQLGRATALIKHSGGHEYGGDENREKALRWLHEQLGKAQSAKK